MSPPSTPTLSRKREGRKSVHRSTGSPRTDHGTLKINYLSVRPEHVEGRTANCDTVSEVEGIDCSIFRILAITFRSSFTPWLLWGRGLSFPFINMGEAISISLKGGSILRLMSRASPR